jgi:hypothetical protein
VTGPAARWAAARLAEEDAPTRGQQISDLLARLGGLLGATQVTLGPAEAQLAREGLCLLARAEAADNAHVAGVAAAKASRPHAVAPLGVRDRMGRPCTVASRDSFPMNATCGVCNEPAQCNDADAGWYHPGRAAGWPVAARPLANDDRGGRARDGACPEHGDNCPHL